MRAKYVALVDGFCTNNGSYYAKAGGSYAVFKVNTDALHPPVDQLKDPILLNLKFNFNIIEGELVNTNNVAEAEALCLLLTELIVNTTILNPDTFTIIYSDSTLIINQVKKLYQVNNTQLKKTYARIDNLFKQYKEKYNNKSIWESLQIKHIPGTVMKQTIIDH